MTEPAPQLIPWTGRPPACGAIAHGATITPHFHEYGQLRYARHGAMVTVTPLGTWVAPANRITWMPAYQVHGGHAYGDTEARILRVPRSLAQRLPSTPAVLAVSPLVREAYLALFEEGAPDRRRPRLLLDVVVTELARAPRDSLRLPEPVDPRLRAVTRLLHADPSLEATLAELGRRTGTSERTLSRLFASELSMSFLQWRTLLRVQRALLELHDGASVTETAIELGWSNPSSFIDSFRSLVGQTPGRYRAAALRDAA